MLSFESVDTSFAQMVESARGGGLELSGAGIPHRIIGGVAAFLHVDQVEPIAARLTPDVDLAVQDENMVAASRLLESLGYVNDGCSFRDPLNPRVWHAVHLISEPVPLLNRCAPKKAFL